MPVKIRIKGTDKYVTANSGKNMWNAAGHAKASLSTSGLCFSTHRLLRELFPDHPEISKHHGYRQQVSFDKVSDILEIEEYKLEKPEVLKKALALIFELENALFHTDIEMQYASLIEDADKFFKENV